MKQRDTKPLTSFACRSSRYLLRISASFIRLFRILISKVYLTHPDPSIISVSNFLLRRLDWGLQFQPCLRSVKCDSTYATNAYAINAATFYDILFWNMRSLAHNIQTNQFRQTSQIYYQKKIKPKTMRKSALPIHSNSIFDQISSTIFFSTNKKCKFYFFVNCLLSRQRVDCLRSKYNKQFKFVTMEVKSTPVSR